MMTIVERLLSRKFIASILAIISCTFLMWFGHIADSVYSVVMISTVGAYIAGNVIQKSKEEVKQNG
jgi:uncharacterized membrane protein